MPLHAIITQKADNSSPDQIYTHERSERRLENKRDCIVKKGWGDHVISKTSETSCNDSITFQLQPRTDNLLWQRRNSSASSFFWGDGCCHVPSSAHTRAAAADVQCRRCCLFPIYCWLVYRYVCVWRFSGSSQAVLSHVPVYLPYWLVSLLLPSFFLSRSAIERSSA